MKTFRNFVDDRGGNFAITFAVLSVPLMVAAGMATTYAFGSLERNRMQQVLDGAVLAGTTLGYSATDQARLTTAYSHTGISAAALGGDQEFDIAVSGSIVEFATQGTSVIGLATMKMPNPFAGVIGDEFVSISVRAKAEKRSSDPVCLLALNRKEPASLQVYGNATLLAPNCAAMVNSGSSQGVQQFGSKAQLTALQIGITGGSSGINIEPQPITDVEPMVDPYAHLPVPKPGPCMDVAAKLSKDSFELEPGTYCGGVTISPGAVVTLKPGVHIIKDGELSIGGNSKLFGTEVMIAFVGAGAVLNSNSGSEITLTSPRSGVYRNIQFMSDRTLDGKWKGEEWMTLSSTTLTYDGVMYLPEQDLWIKGNTVINAKSPSMAMVADQIWVQDGSEVRISQEDSRGLGIGTAGLAFKHAARLSN